MSDIKVFDITLEKVEQTKIKVFAKSRAAAMSKVKKEGYLISVTEDNYYDGYIYHNWVTVKKDIAATKTICNDMYMYMCHTLYELSQGPTEGVDSDQADYKKMYKLIKKKNWKKFYTTYRRCDTAVREVIPYEIIAYVRELVDIDG